MTNFFIEALAFLKFGIDNLSILLQISRQRHPQHSPAADGGASTVDSYFALGPLLTVKPVEAIAGRHMVDPVTSPTQV